MSGIISIFLNGRNYYYIQGEYEDYPLYLTYQEMYRLLQRSGRISSLITDDVLDNDEHNATSDFYDENGELF